MSRFRRRRPLLLTLAFIASLLLSLLPTLGRLQQAFAAADAGGNLLAICTTRGLEFQVAGFVVDAAWAADRTSAEALASDPSGKRGGHAPQGDDCAYCPLLAALDLPVSPVSGLRAVPLRQTVLSLQAAPRISVQRFAGLGARGPPRIRPAG